MNIGQECSSHSTSTEECYKVTKPTEVLKVIVSELLSRAKRGDTESLDILQKAFRSGGGA
jgi:hypothetical protein